VKEYFERLMTIPLSKALYQSLEILSSYYSTPTEACIVMDIMAFCLKGLKMKVIKVRKDKATGDHYLKLSDFKGFVDIKRVKKYTLEPVDDCNGETQTKSLILKFYDENDQVVEAKS
jgi:hypothetical protein